MKSKDPPRGVVGLYWELRADDLSLVGRIWLDVGVHARHRCRAGDGKEVREEMLEERQPTPGSAARCPPHGVRELAYDGDRDRAVLIAQELKVGAPEKRWWALSGRGRESPSGNRRLGIGGWRRPGMPGVFWAGDLSRDAGSGASWLPIPPR